MPIVQVPPFFNGFPPMLQLSRRQQAVSVWNEVADSLVVAIGVQLTSANNASSLSLIIRAVIRDGLTDLA